MIFNRVGGGMYDVLKKTIEAELPVKCLGYIPKMDWLNIESRHLGLVLPDEIADLKGLVKRLGKELERTLDWEGILALGAEERAADTGAGGIVSAAVDGLRVAQQIIAVYKPMWE